MKFFCLPFNYIVLTLALLLTGLSASSQELWLNGVYSTTGAYSTISDWNAHCRGDIQLVQNGMEFWMLDISPYEYSNIASRGYVIEAYKVSTVTGKSEVLACNSDLTNLFVFFNTEPQTEVAEDRGTIIIELRLPPEYMYWYGEQEFEHWNNYYKRIILSYTQPGLPELKGGIIWPDVLSRSWFAPPTCLGQDPAKNGSGVYYYQWERISLALGSAWTAISGATSREYCPNEEGVYRRKVTDSEGKIAYTNEHRLELEVGSSWIERYEWRSYPEISFHQDSPLILAPEGNDWTTLQLYQNHLLLNSSSSYSYEGYKVLVEQPNGHYRAESSWGCFLYSYYHSHTADGMEFYFGCDENLSGKTIRGKILICYRVYGYYQDQLLVAEIPFEQAPHVYIDTPLSPPAIGYNQLLYTGEQPSVLSVINPAVGGYRPVSQWQRRTANTGWQAVETYLLPYETGCMPLALENESVGYRLRVASYKENQVVYSNEVWLTLVAKLTGGTITGTQTIPIGQDVNPFTGVSPASGGKSQEYAYVWQRYFAETDEWQDISAATAENSYLPEKQEGTQRFRRKVVCGSDVTYSNEVTLTVRVSLYGGSIAGTQTVQSGQQASAFSSLEAASGGTCQNYSYVWQRYADGAWQTISSATGLTYIPEAILGNWRYRRQVSCGEEVAYTNEVGLTVADAGTYGTLHPHIPNTHEVSTAYAVGEIPISASVSPVGSATYTIPIEVTPGLNGVQPNLSLVYNSNSGNSVLGIGWSLSGLSAIAHTGSTIYHDGYVGPVNLNSPLVLDGMRLIKMEEFSGNIIYETEQGNIRVTAYVTSFGKEKYFKVLYPNGMAGIFGDENNLTPSENQLCYPLTKLIDANGNYMTFNYDFRNERYYIKRIDYGASKAGSEHFASVQLSYKTRSDITSGYVAGKKLTEDYLLDKVDCFSGNTLLYTYSFTYETDVVSLLTQVDYTADGVGLNPLKFYYGTSTGKLMSIERENALLPANYNVDCHSMAFVRGKFVPESDDDGLIEYLQKETYIEYYRPPGTFNHSEHYYYNRYDYYANEIEDKIFIYQQLKENETANPTELRAGKGFIQILTADIDGIPGDEIIKVNNNVVNGRDVVTIEIFERGDTQGIRSYSKKDYDFGAALSDASGNKSIHPKLYYTGDFNGDGVNELLAVSIDKPIGIENLHSTCYLLDLKNQIIRHTQAAFIFNPREDKDKGKDGEMLLLLDFDGDGKADICHVKNDGTDIYTLSGSTTSLYGSFTKIASTSLLKSGLLKDRRYESKNRQFLLGDINNDGKTDILIPPTGSEEEGENWKVYFSKGASGFELVNMPVEIQNNYVGNYNYSSHDLYFSLQDINNDGRLDLICSVGYLLDVHLNTNGLINYYWDASVVSYARRTPILIPAEVGMTTKGYSQILQITGWNGYTVQKFHFTRDDGTQRLLTGVVNSFGTVAKIEYMRLNENEAYHQNYNRNGGKFPFQSVIGPIPVITKTEAYLNNIQLSAMQYQYNNAVLHRQGLGLLGFETVTATDMLRNRTATSRYNIFDPNSSQPTYLYNTLAEEEVAGISKATYQYNIVKSRTVSVRLANKTTYDYLKGTSIHAKSLYDDYGNPNFESVDYGDGLLVNTTTDYINKRSDTENVLGLPVLQKQTRNRAGNTWTTGTGISYDSNHRPLTSIKFVEGGQVSETQYGYDVMGNLTSEKSRTYSATDWLESRYEYSPNGRFLTKSTDPMGLSNTYTYDSSKGLLLTATDHKGNVTTYNSYDSFGRLLNATSPDGTVSQTSREWAVSGDNQLYRVVKTATGTPASVNYYDGLGRELKQGSQGFDGTYVFTENHYDRLGRLTKQSAPYRDGTGAQQWTETSYDSFDRVQQVVQPTGRTLGYSYSGNSVTSNDAGLVSTRHYNAWGELVGVDDSGGSIRYAYRADGQPLNITAPGGTQTTFAYDGYGRQTQLVDPSAGTLSYTYDAAGNLNSQTNARGQTISTTFNRFGQPRKRETPEMTTVYSYDPTDYRLLSVESSNGTRQGYTYDNLGRTLTETEQLGAEQLTTTYTYSGNKLQSTLYSKLPNRPLSYRYNAYGYLEAMELSGGPVLWQLNQTNELGQPLTETFGNGLKQQYRYSPTGALLEQKLIKASNTWVFKTLSYTVDETKGLLMARTHGGYMQEQFGYDNLRRLTEIRTGGAPLMQVGYSAVGNVTSKTDAGTLSYTTPGKPYAISEQEVNLPPQIRYVNVLEEGVCMQPEAGNLVATMDIQLLDANGNKLAANIPGTTTLIYGKSGNKEEASVNTSASVDLGSVYTLSTVNISLQVQGSYISNYCTVQVSADGQSWQTLGDPVVRYDNGTMCRNYALVKGVPLRTQDVQYASFDRPLSIEENGYRADFTYNASGDRQLMAVTHNDALQLSRYYIGSCYEKDISATGAVTERLYLGGSPYTAPAVWVKQNGAEQLYYIQRDHLGSIVTLTTQSGGTAGSHSYDAWGRLRQLYTLEPYAADLQPELLLGRGYTGHEHLPWFGLINMNARLYDPVLGRFLSPDPYVQLPDFSQNFNRYTYGLNNPLLYTDPSGEYALIDDILAAVIGGTVNLIGNAISGNVNSWGEGFAYFGWGALAGEATLYSGPVAGAGILSAGNSLTNQVSVGDWENVNANRLLFDTMLGMSTAYIGGQLSPIIAGPVGSVMSTFTSNEMVQMIATQTVTTALTGFMLGTGTSLLNGMSFEDALKVGMSSGLNGLVTGFTTSSIKAYLDLKSSWTKDRTYPNNLEEQLTLEEARNGQGREIMKGQTNDPEWYGWQKMQHIHKTPTGDNITIHFWKNPITGEVTGFKFKE